MDNFTDTKTENVFCCAMITASDCKKHIRFNKINSKLH